MSKKEKKFKYTNSAFFFRYEEAVSFKIMVENILKTEARIRDTKEGKYFVVDYNYKQNF